MAKRKKKATKKQGRHSQNLLMMATGALLTLCVLSISYGYLIRQSVAENKVQDFRIEILNGTGQSGLASKAADVLRQRGIDVLDVSNADHFTYSETILIGRKSGRDLAALGRSLGCDNVIEQLVDDSLVDATLILGADFDELNMGLGGDSRLSD